MAHTRFLEEFSPGEMGHRNLILPSASGFMPCETSWTLSRDAPHQQV